MHSLSYAEEAGMIIYYPFLRAGFVTDYTSAPVTVLVRLAPASRVLVFGSNHVSVRALLTNLNCTMAVCRPLSPIMIPMRSRIKSSLSVMSVASKPLTLVKARSS